MAFLVAGVSRGEQLRHVAALPPHVLSVEPSDDDQSLNAAAAAAGAAARLPEGRRHTIRIPVTKEGHCTSDTASPIVRPGSLRDRERDPVRDRQRLACRRDDEHTTRLPGHFVDRGQAYSALPSALVPPGVVRDQGWTTTTESVLVSFAAGTKQSAIDGALDAADQAGVSAFVERGATGWDGRILPAIALISALVTLLGVAISVALSAAEGRADIATLAAVGAPPHRRRTLVASQALVIGGLGCALGVALGTFVAFTARATTAAPGLVVPWGNLLATGVAVPLLAALVAALCTRSHLPLVRRAE